MNQLLVVMGNSSFFASRAFLPALILILCYRFHEYIPFIDAGGEYNSETSWLFSDITLYSLIALSILEFLAVKNQDLREFLEEFMKKLRIAFAVLINLSLLSPDTAAVLQQTQFAGYSFMQLFAILSGAIVYKVGQVRQEIYELVQDFDDDDDLKLQFSLTILEDLLIVIGIVLLLAIPIVVIGGTILVLILIQLQKRHYAKVEDRTRIACGSCGDRILPAAWECYNCGTVNPHPKEVGTFGQMTGKESTNPTGHREHLLAARRCPFCAEKLPKHNMKHSCETCKKQVTREDFFALLQLKRRNLPTAYVLLTVSGLIPVVGMIITILYIRFNYIKPYRQYLPTKHAFFNRLFINILTFFCMFLQAVPLVGSLIPPLLLFVNYSVWERSYRRGIEKSFPVKENPMLSGASVDEVPTEVTA